MDWLIGFFRDLHRAGGINLTIIYDAFDRARMIDGALTTARLAVCCLILSLAMGIGGAWLQTAGSRWLRAGVNAYVQFFRNTPPLVQLYFFYFAIGSLMPTVRDAFGHAEPMVSNFAWAVIALSLVAGAFNVEIFRSGVEAVPRATIEAAESLGFSRAQIYLRIVLPLAFRICLPALNNNLVQMVKSTSLAYAIAVPEMLYVANQIWSDAVNVPEMMTFLLVAYVVMIGALLAGMHRFERALPLPGARPAA